MNKNPQPKGRARYTQHGWEPVSDYRQPRSFASELVWAAIAIIAAIIVTIVL